MQSVKHTIEATWTICNVLTVTFVTSSRTEKPDTQSNSKLFHAKVYKGQTTQEKKIYQKYHAILLLKPLFLTIPSAHIDSATKYWNKNVLWLKIY